VDLVVATTTPFHPRQSLEKSKLAIEASEAKDAARVLPEMPAAALGMEQDLGCC